MSTNKTADGLILVIGATGTQGGATARRLLAQGARVRIGRQSYQDGIVAVGVRW